MVWTPPAQATLIARLPAGNAVTDPRALLRLSLPITNQPIREIQDNLEGISNLLRGKRWGGINGNIAKATSLLSYHKADLLASAGEAHQAEAEALMTQINAGLVNLKTLAEHRDRPGIIAAKAEVLDQIGELEALMVKGFPFEVPAAYSQLPQLQGRATVELETSKGPITVILDGYSAPVNAGNFVDLVQRGFYDGLSFTRAEESYVLQAGDPPGPATGFTDPATGKYRAVPMEILVQGDRQPIYGTTLEDAGRYLETPVLPFAAYGTLATARPGDDPNGGSSQFFFLLFEPELTPAGTNLLDGRYSVFGYVVSGQEVLGQLRQGDKIESARVIQGLENLVMPQTPAAA